MTLDVLIKPRKFVPQRADYSPRPDAPLLTHQVTVRMYAERREGIWGACPCTDDLVIVAISGDSGAITPRLVAGPRGASEHRTSFSL